MARKIIQTPSTLVVTPTALVLAFSAPLAEVIEALAAIEVYGVDGLTAAIVSLLLYLLGLVGDLQKSSEDEDEVNQDTDVHQADATSQFTANNDTSKYDNLLVETAANDASIDTESEETKRCPECGDLAQPDSKYCAHCARKQ